MIRTDRTGVIQKDGEERLGLNGSRSSRSLQWEPVAFGRGGGRSRIRIACQDAFFLGIRDTGKSGSPGMCAGLLYLPVCRDSVSFSILKKPSFLTGSPSPFTLHRRDCRVPFVRVAHRLASMRPEWAMECFAFIYLRSINSAAFHVVTAFAAPGADGQLYTLCIFRSAFRQNGFSSAMDRQAPHSVNLSLTDGRNR
jgi:hypothetical protein